MRTDFPFELYTTPLCVRVATRLTLNPPIIGGKVYLYFEHTSMDYWVMNADEELLAAINFNLSLPYWNEMKETEYWYNSLAHHQSVQMGVNYDTVRKWYPKGSELTNEMLLSE